MGHISFSELVVGTNYDMQAQLREVTLQEENAAYEKAILNCENNIQEKTQEVDLLQKKFEVSYNVMNLYLDVSLALIYITVLLTHHVMLRTVYVVLFLNMIISSLFSRKFVVMNLNHNTLYCLQADILGSLESRLLCSMIF